MFTFDLDARRARIGRPGEAPIDGHNVEKYWRDCKEIQLWEGGAQLGRFDVVRGYYDFQMRNAGVGR
jgi:alkylation response protein AidB-like acyl-CoA dehydrogenase